jgi:hypothetical protein
MMTSNLVLITGYAGSGKDEVGKILLEAGYKRYAFADLVKIHTSDKHGFDIELTKTQEGKNTVVTSKFDQQIATVRQFLIDESAFMKVVYNNPAFWALLLEKQIKELPPHNVVITDWRYEAELNHFLEEFNLCKITKIRIHRDSVKPLTDPSEHNIDHIPCDHTIQNNGTLEELRNQVSALGI